MSNGHLTKRKKFKLTDSDISWVPNGIYDIKQEHEHEVMIKVEDDYIYFDLDQGEIVYIQSCVASRGNII